VIFVGLLTANKKWRFFLGGTSNWHDEVRVQGTGGQIVVWEYLLQNQLPEIALIRCIIWVHLPDLQPCNFLDV
jgi:hypothetical protein